MWVRPPRNGLVESVHPEMGPVPFSVHMCVQLQEIRDFWVFQESVLVRMSPDPSDGLPDLKIAVGLASVIPSVPRSLQAGAVGLCLEQSPGSEWWAWNVGRVNNVPLEGASQESPSRRSTRVF